MDWRRNSFGFADFPCEDGFVISFSTGAGFSSAVEVASSSLVSAVVSTLTRAGSVSGFFAVEGVSVSELVLVSFRAFEFDIFLLT